MEHSALLTIGLVSCPVALYSQLCAVRKVILLVFIIAGYAPVQVINVWDYCHTAQGVSSLVGLHWEWYHLLGTWDFLAIPTVGGSRQKLSMHRHIKTYSSLFTKTIQ